jgi:hypothetical protein
MLMMMRRRRRRREEVARAWRRRHIEELRNLQASLSIIQLIKSKMLL